LRAIEHTNLTTISNYCATGCSYNQMTAVQVAVV